MRAAGVGWKNVLELSLEKIGILDPDDLPFTGKLTLTISDGNIQRMEVSETIK
jgi:hypothetical protein